MRQNTLLLKKGPGRPRLVSVSRGRPRRKYNMVLCAGNRAGGDKLNDHEDILDDPEELDNPNSPEDLFKDCHEVNIVGIIANAVEISMTEGMSDTGCNEWKDAIYKKLKSLIEDDTWD